MSILSFTTYLNPFSYIKGSSSDHYKNSSNYLSKATVTAAEAGVYATKTAGNVAEIGIQASLGAMAALTAAREGINLNAGIQTIEVVAPVLLKPVLNNIDYAIKAGLIFSIQHPVAAMGIGAAAAIIYSPESAISAVKNAGNFAYKVGETAIDLAAVTGEGMIGTALYAKETCQNIGGYFAPQNGFGIDGNTCLSAIDDVEISGAGFELVDYSIC